MSLTTRIVIAMILGLLTGSLINYLGAQGATPPALNQWIDQFLVQGLFDTFGLIFIKSLKLLVVPLVFVSLVCGVASLGGSSRMGVVAGKTIALYMATTALAISLAVAVAVVVQPGQGIDLNSAAEFSASQAPSLKQTLVNLFPSNPVEAMAEGNILQVIVFALLMGLAITKSGDPGQRVAHFFNDTNEIIMKMVKILMVIAPYGIYCLLAKLFSGLGLGVILSLAKYFFTVVFVLLLHSFGVYSSLLKAFTGLSPKVFLTKIRTAMAFGFSTASSGATLPITLRTVEKRLGVDNKIASFTVPLGATINMDGTAIMQGVATVFISQAYNIPLELGDYLLVILTATMASIGTAAVPGVGLVMLVMVLNQVGLPVEGISLILGVDRLLDMMRTATNVAGDAMVSTVIAKGEGFLDTGIFKDPEAGVVIEENESAGNLHPA